VKNQLGFTQEIDNAAIVKTNVSISATKVSAPDGSVTGQKIVENTANAAHEIRTTAYTPVANTPLVLSVYLKQGERRYARVGFPGAWGGSSGYVIFDLQTGTQTYSSNVGLAFSITATGDGWYRCSVGNTVTIAASSTAYIGPNNNSTTGTSYTGDGTSGLFIWGAQLSDSASLDPYVYNPGAAPASTAYYGPRFDYDPVTLAPKGLLIEEQRTNLLLYSTDLSTGWTKGTAATWVLNAATAPDGTMTALQGNGIFGTGLISTGTTLYRLANTVSGSTTYTFSVYVRTQTGTATDVRLRLNETGGNNTISSDFTVTTAWTRISWTVTTAAGATAISTLVGTGTLADLYIWGAQLEAGAFATSYIPTVASQVTRAADVAVMTGANFSNWYLQNDGTFFAEFISNPVAIVASVSGERGIIEVSSGFARGHYFRATTTLSSITRDASGAYIPTTVAIIPGAVQKIAGI
jgi:hypothetical protein